MIRFILRVLGMLVLALAVVFAIGDIARSFTDGVMRLTPLAEAVNYFALRLPPGGGLSLSPFFTRIWTVASPWPASVSLAIVAFLLLFAGRPVRRERDPLLR